MPGYQAWPTATSMEDWMIQQEKRVLHEERRPVISTASDLMGPGLAPYAVPLSDWNGEEATFNGIWFSEADTGVLNSPDPTRPWIGVSYGTVDGAGYQQAWDRSDPVVSYTRTFETVGVTPTYTDWVLLATGGGGGGLTAEQVRDIIAAALVEGTGIDIVVNDLGDTITITNTGVVEIDEVVTYATGAEPSLSGVADGTLWVEYGTGITEELTLGYTHVQASPDTTWVINHPLAFYPNVTIVDSSNRQVEGDVEYTDADTITVTFSAAFAGKAFLT